MATLTVNILPNDINYDPDPTNGSGNPTIYPGDTVTFALVRRSDAVTVTFADGSPFSTTTVQIAGGATTSSAPKTVRTDVVASTTYRFTVPQFDPGKEQPGTLSGGLEVGTGRPPEPPTK